MKTHSTLLLIFVFSLLISSSRAQIPSNGGKIDTLYQTTWNHSGLLPETRANGLTPVTPAEADFLEIISPGGNVDAQISNAIQAAVGNNGVTMIFFPGGVYQIASPIVLRRTSSQSNIIFRGAGAPMQRFLNLPSDTMANVLTFKELRQV
ncbi:MAG: hypothetical protein GWP06_11385 [Actinobacteria bacterium]|nr:hypothetical protein [Actinomycetota bacterium]